MYIYVCVCFLCMYLCIYCIMPLLCTNDDYVTRMHLPLYLYIYIIMHICTFILHIQAYTCAEKKIYVKKAQEISRVHMRHMLIAISTRMYIMFPRWTSWFICIAWFRGSARSDTSRKPTVPESVEGEIYKTHENECFRLDNLRQEIHKFWVDLTSQWADYTPFWPIENSHGSQADLKGLGALIRALSCSGEAKEALNMLEVAQVGGFLQLFLICQAATFDFVSAYVM